MLEEIRISSAGNYPADQRLTGCKQINFVFGANGSGKTTISRIIARPGDYPSCQLTWAGGRELECLVYNVDFAQRSFASHLPGIFTLGEDSAEALGKIEALKAEQAKLELAIDQLNNTLRGNDGTAGKVAELAKLKDELDASCWTSIKQPYDDDFREAFAGCRNSRTTFCDRLLSEAENNTSELKDMDELRARASVVYSALSASEEPIQLPRFDGLLAAEVDTILAKKILGKQDVDIAGLIDRLKNSDWVGEGRDYWNVSKPHCPFCQQEVRTNLTESLEEYFDDTYLLDVASVARVLEGYQVSADAVKSLLAEILNTGSKYLDVETLQKAYDLLEAKLAANIGQLKKKRAEPSTVVLLDTLGQLAVEIEATLAEANAGIANHNALLGNRAAEKVVLGQQVWRRLVAEADNTLKEYSKASGGVRKAIESLTGSIASKQAELDTVNASIASLESTITSVEPTVRDINRILSSFGFTNFKLKTAGERKDFYEIVRPDGADAARTLSEGEKGFLTFLYFYNRIRGSETQSGMTSDRIVVFDDPVSSLDSDVLFIVSTLIKKTLDEAVAGNGQIKQVFVLTHNIYFHKEVSFDSRRDVKCRAHETFWVVRKRGMTSALEQFDHNPIKTSYELLWREVRDSGQSKATIQNTLRRIIESYFKILGNIDRDQIIEMFEGREKQICGSLFSWVNDGSHGVHDDLYVSADDAVIESYLKVFRDVFKKAGHEAHFNMMMGPIAVASLANVPPVAVGEPIVVPEEFASEPPIESEEASTPPDEIRT